MQKQNPIAILGAMPQELTTLNAQLENADVTEVYGMKINSGFIDNQAVVIMQCGIGKVNATIATTLLIERFSPRAVINTGSAGGIGEGLSIGDVVIGDTVAHHDLDVTPFRYQIAQMAQMPADYVCDSKLITAAKKASIAFGDVVIHQGQIVSGDQFIAGAERFSWIKQHFPKALAVEMEASAIAQTCYHFQTPFVVVRAISDLANAQASESFDTFIDKAGRQSAHMVLSMLEAL